MPTSPLRVALVQTTSIPGDVSANAHAAARAITTAAERGAKLVVFPELFLTGYELDLLAKTASAWLEDERDSRLDAVRHACRATGATAILGAPFRDRGGDGAIAAPIVGPDDRVLVSFKEHVHSSETALFRSRPPLAPFEVGDWRIAVGICFDAAHPGHAEQAAKRGADLYAVSSFYMYGEERRLDLHLGARAMDNRVFSVLANYAASSGGFVSCGISGAWSPSGEVIERVNGTGEALPVVDLDPAALAAFRR